MCKLKCTLYSFEIKFVCIISGKTSTLQTTGKNKKQKTQLSEVDIKFMKFMDATAQEEKSRSMNFFRGISDTVDKFSDENMINFQFQVLSIIKSIQQRERLPAPIWGQSGHQTGAAHASSQFPMYGYSTAATPSFRQDFDFGHSSGLEPIPSRPESVHSVSATSTEENFDFSREFT